jgi:hypothetical protein|tara:strand:- start:1811 stop:3121 length:1311 start_codon:yes stop_codon:yes gene_type:complete
MAYCIMRFEKHKTASIGGLAGSLAHTMRSRYTPNADPELTKDNRVLLGPSNTADVALAIRDRWPEKHRKDAIGCLEFFIGASPEWFQQHGGQGDQDAYFQHAIDWLKAEYGAENVVSVVQHNDETSPHLAAYVVPRDPETGRLNAKRWTGGRAACAQMQTRFQEFAGAPVGLDRGVRGSQATHTTISQWYAGQSDLDEREKEIEQAQWKGEATLTLRETDVNLKASKIASQARDLKQRAELLAEQENAVQSKSEALQAQNAAIAERERRLAALERELTARGERLVGGEAALQKRQAEIDAAGAQLQQRLADARQRQEAFKTQMEAREKTLRDTAKALKTQVQDFNQRRTAWLEANRPQVPELVTKLLKVGEMGRVEAAEFMIKPENDDLMDHYDPVSMTYSDEALALLAKYQGADAEKQRWERTVEPPKGYKPHEL